MRPVVEGYLERLIRRALNEARAAGLDQPGQSWQAMREVRRVRPDLSETDAQAAVDEVLWERSRGA